MRTPLSGHAGTGLPTMVFPLYIIIFVEPPAWTYLKWVPDRRMKRQSMMPNFYALLYISGILRPIQNEN